MKKRFLAVFAVLLGMTGCQGNVGAGQADTAQAALESQQITTTTAAEQTTEQTSKSVETTTETTAAEEVSEDIAVSREYEFDLEKYLDNHDQYLIRDELEFLSDEQYDTYIRAWIFIDNFEYFNIINTNKIKSHWLDDDGNVYENYFTYDETGAKSILPYMYISTYQSFYEYLQSVFTRDAADEIMSHSFFKTVGDELYFAYGERGGPIDIQTGRYELKENNGSEIIFEYIVNHTHDGNEWTTSHTIKLINTDDGWRSELFEYLKEMF